MKLTAALATALLATNASALFDKWAPWGKRDYSCINVVQGIPENATVTAGTAVTIRFNRDSGRCGDLYDNQEAGPYTLWLYNNPKRVPNSLAYDAMVKLQDNIPECPGDVTVTIPSDLPAVKDESVWYLRLETYLPNAPQMPSLFYAQGPFRITA